MANEERDMITTVGLLFEAAKYLQRAIADDVEQQTGLTGTWFETLARLQRSDLQGMRMNEMAAQVSFPPSSFSRLIDRMEAAGLVERVVDPKNRRATLLRLTPQGEVRIADAVAVHEPIARARFADLLSDRELNTLESITRKIRDANRTGSIGPQRSPGTSPDDRAAALT